MGNEKDEPPSEAPPSLLGSLPPTDPAVLKAMEDARLGNIHYSAIGQVAAEWAYFEAVIDTWMITFAGIEIKTGICFTAQMTGPRQRIDGFIALVRHLGANKRRWNQKLEDFATAAIGMAEQRNRVIHDVWRMEEPAQPHRLEASARRAVRVVQIPVPTETLMQLVDNIRKLERRFDDMASAIFTELDTLRGTLPPSTPE